MPNLVNVQTGQSQPIPYEDPQALLQAAQLAMQSGGQVVIVDNQGQQIDPQQILQMAQGGGGGMQEGDLMSAIQHIQQGMQNGTIQPSAGGMGPASSGAPDPSMMGPDPMLAAGQQAQATGHQPGQTPNLIQERLLGG